MSSRTELDHSEMEQLEFSFGVITDIQYADIPDGHSFQGVPRYYRHSLESLQRAVHSWNDKKGLSFVIQLGDLVDGYCPKDESYNAVSKVLTAFNSFQQGAVYHVIGNHCLYNLPHSDLNCILRIPSNNESSYYSFTPAAGFRVVVLDAYDISVIGWPEGHPHRIEASRLLEEKNRNLDKNSPQGLVGTEERFVMYNGGIGGDQLMWLNDTLKDATAHGQKVIICCHIPLHPGATFPSALLWNYAEVLEVIHKFRCVKVCLAGHAHTGGYTLDSHGVHHRVLEAVLECPPGTDAFGQVNVYQHRLSLVGTGYMESTEMYFD